MVQTAAQLTLVELLEQRDLPAQMVRERAQSQLDRMQSGLQLASVQIPERIAPLAVRNAVQAVQAAREDAKTNVEKARQDANTRLLAAAGPRYGEILDMIAAYEGLLSQVDASRPQTKQDADAKLAEIGRRLEQPDIGGMAARTVARGRAYQVQVEATLGAEQRRLASLAPSFRQNPRQLVRQLWLEALRDTLTSPTTEVFSVPQGTGALDVAIKSANDIMQARRNAELERKKLEAQMLGAQDPAFQLGSRQIMIDKAGRRLEKDGKKGFAQP
jgi:regulator of protease activity HflC (stomatin/prohibitin superfamily)